jgi:hypothetical protein
MGLVLLRHPSRLRDPVPPGVLKVPMGLVVLWRPRRLGRPVALSAQMVLGCLAAPEVRWVLLAPEAPPSRARLGRVGSPKGFTECARTQTQADSRTVPQRPHTRRSQPAAPTSRPVEATRRGNLRASWQILPFPGAEGVSHTQTGVMNRRKHSQAWQACLANSLICETGIVLRGRPDNRTMKRDVGTGHCYTIVSQGGISHSTQGLQSDRLGYARDGPSRSLAEV